MKSKLKKIVLNNTGVIRSVVVVILVFVTIFGFFLLNCSVPTASMDPTIGAGDRVIANRLAYKNKDVSRGDVVIFEYPDNEDILFTKRIIGLPGEVVSIINGSTFVNNEKLEEKYLVNDHTGDYGPFYIPKQGDEVTVKDAEYDENGNLVSGVCYIGKYKVGTVDAVTQYDALGQIQGEAPGFIDKYCYKEDDKYIVAEDTYFCLGDNRDNSHDARFWGNQYVCKKNIVGKMELNLSKGFKRVK